MPIVLCEFSLVRFPPLRSMLRVSIYMLIDWSSVNVFSVGSLPPLPLLCSRQWLLISSSGPRGCCFVSRLISSMFCLTLVKSVSLQCLFFFRKLPCCTSLTTNVDIFSRVKWRSLVNENILSVSFWCTRMNTSELHDLTTYSALRKRPRFFTQNCSFQILYLPCLEADI